MTDIHAHCELATLIGSAFKSLARAKHLLEATEALQLPGSTLEVWGA